MKKSIMGLLLGGLFTSSAFAQAPVNYVPEIVVQFKRSAEVAPLAIQPRASALNALERLNVINRVKLKLKYVQGRDHVVVKLENARDASEVRSLVNRLKSDPTVANVSEVPWVSPMAFNDPGWTVSQQALYGDSNVYKSELQSAMVNYPGLEKGVTVAVIDTGVARHLDFNSKIVGELNQVETNRLTDATERAVAIAECSRQATPVFHGTAVSSLAVGQSNDNLGVAGVAPEASLLAIRSLSDCGAPLNRVADAILWAVNKAPAELKYPDNPNPAKIINLSLGSSEGIECPFFMQEAIDVAVMSGAIVLAAAGNGNSTQIATPANCKNVIPVGAASKNGVFTSYSSFEVGKPLLATIGGGNGEGLAVADGRGTEGFKLGAGTSYASPILAGLMAKAAGIDPNLSFDKIQQIAVQTGQTFEFNNKCTAGAACGTMVKAESFLAALLPTPPTPEEPTPVDPAPPEEPAPVEPTPPKEPVPDEPAPEEPLPEEPVVEEPAPQPSLDKAFGSEIFGFESISSLSLGGFSGSDVQDAVIRARISQLGQEVTLTRKVDNGETMLVVDGLASSSSATARTQETKGFKVSIVDGEISVTPLMQPMPPVDEGQPPVVVDPPVDEKQPPAEGEQPPAEGELPPGGGGGSVGLVGLIGMGLLMFLHKKARFLKNSR